MTSERRSLDLVTAFHRPPRVREIVQPVEVELTAPPIAPRDQHRTPLVRLLVMTLLPALLPPLLLGFVVWALGQSMTIVITSVALSAGMGLAVVITVLMSRRDEDIRIRAERDEYAANVARYEASMRAIDAQCADLVARERRILAREFPGQAALDESALGRTARLWERRPGDNDFLTVRVGVGRRPTSIKFKRATVGESSPLADAIERAHATIDPGPVTAVLDPATTKGVFGSREAVDATLRHIAHQLASQHSPSEVRMAVFSRDEAFCGWAKWLPHCRLSTKVETTSLVARTGIEAATALRAITQELSSRSKADGGWSYVIIADGRNWDSLPGRLARLLPRRDRVCVFVAEERFEDLPTDAGEVLDLSEAAARILRATEPGTPPTFAAEVFDDAAAMKSALAVSDLSDAGAGMVTPIPRSARLAELLGPTAMSAENIAAAWEKSREAFKLATPIGVGPNDQVVEIDLRRDGPHALLAGTTGSGKSEFLQSLVASLSVRIPPDLLNFVLFDYKGGSAFSEVAALPQVVGVVTDLDERVAQRALESLRAEMRRREHLLASVSPAANNITEYQSVRRATPLANLIIIIDEFHRLVTEQPDFIDEMVRIAQQGRSLGVHLILSTQKPSGVVTDQIRANTNLRIALRVTDETDSRDVLNTEEAAAIPRDVPGRLYIRVGTEPLRACQAARVSGLVRGGRDTTGSLSGRPFLEPIRSKVVRRNGIAARLLPREDQREEDDDEAPMVDERALLVQAVKEATVLSRLPKSAAPWREPLPMSVALRELGAPDELSRTAAVIGLLDEPELQRQRPLALDLESGHVCIAGSGNAGKTTALLMLAEAFASRMSPSELHVYGLDFAGGDLRRLDTLPHSGGVAAQHELPRVHWVLQALKDIVDERLANPAADAAHLLVLVDNFTGLWTAIQDGDAGQELTETVTRVMDVGRAVGVTFAITAERPDTLRTNLFAMMSTRLALPMVDAEGYAAFGLSKVARTSDPIQGRAILAGRTPHEVQLGWPSRIADGEAWPPHESDGGPLRIAPLPPQVEHAAVLAMAPVQPASLLLGLREGTHPLFEVSPEQHLVVLGPRRSGRSNTLAVVLDELRRTGASRVFVVNPRRSPAVREAAHRWGEAASLAESGDDVVEILDRLADATNEAFARYASGGEPSGRWGVVVDDFDVLDLSGRGAEALERLALRGIDVGATVYVSAETQALRASYPSGVIRTLLNQRTGILLAPQTSEDFDLLGARGRPGRVPAGRGCWCEGGGKTAVQISFAGP